MLTETKPLQKPPAVHESMRIAGERVGGSRTLDVLNPFTGAVVGTVPRASVDDIVAHTVGRALDQFGIPNELFKRWRSPGSLPSSA